MTFIQISSLNDFMFCPYSIYLHGIYNQVDESLYHAAPQVRGSFSHESTDNRKASTKKDVLMAMPVYSDSLGLIGKIDSYIVSEGRLIERKYQLKTIYRGQLYQIWAQYFCLWEMGYDVKELSFYEISTKRTIPVKVPGEDEYNELEALINRYMHYCPDDEIEVNVNKCLHCIYCPMCDKTDSDNVY